MIEVSHEPFRNYSFYTVVFRGMKDRVVTAGFEMDVL